MMEASDTSAFIEYQALPLLDKKAVFYYIEKGCIPGGTKRNYASYGHKLEINSEDQINILCDPQTSGGLLIAIDKNHAEKFIQLIKANVLMDLKPIGKVIGKEKKSILVG